MPGAVLTALGLVAILGIAWVDAVTDPHISFSVFYILPLAVVAWYGGRLRATALGLVAALIGLAMGVHETSATGAGDFAVAWNAATRFLLFVIVILAMDRLRAANDRLKDLALNDPLTGVPNTRSFELTAQRYLALARRGNRPVALGYIDLDDFKRLNDEFGHAKGDEALRAVAEAIQGGIRDGDSMARVGGDEFVVLLPGTDIPTAMAVMERLRRRIREALAAGEMAITVSIGVAEHEPDETLDELVRGADTLMYLAKRSGKDQVAAPAVSSRRAG